jgi:hypothetical protein
VVLSHGPSLSRQGLTVGSGLWGTRIFFVGTEQEVLRGRHTAGPSTSLRFGRDDKSEAGVLDSIDCWSRSKSRSEVFGRDGDWIRTLFWDRVWACRTHTDV